MFRIVEDECPPIPERFSGPLAAFLKECFHKDPAMRPSAEQLFEHEWLKNHWGLNKVGCDEISVGKAKCADLGLETAR